MLHAAAPNDFLEAPIGRWTATPTSVVWCQSPTLCGSTAWGRPTETDTRDLLRLFDSYRHPALAERFDLVLDGQGIEAVDVHGLAVLLDYTRDRLAELRRRVRQHIGVIPRGATGVSLADVLPAIADDSHPCEVFTDARAAYRALGDGGPAVHDEIAAIVDGVRGAAPEVGRLRDLLAEKSGNVSVEQAARALGLATRTLQRVLARQGTSFRHEQITVRFQLADELLTTTDIKLSALAARLGLSESGLAALIRARSGMTPAEYRRTRGKRDE